MRHIAVCRRWLFSFLPVFLIGCGEPGIAPHDHLTHDAGQDAGLDAGPDGTDAGDAGPDGGADAGRPPSWIGGVQNVTVTLAFACDGHDAGVFQTTEEWVMQPNPPQLSLANDGNGPYFAVPDMNGGNDSPGPCDISLAPDGGEWVPITDLDSPYCDFHFDPNGVHNQDTFWSLQVGWGTITESDGQVSANLGGPAVLFQNGGHPGDCPVTITASFPAPP